MRDGVSFAITKLPYLCLGHVQVWLQLAASDIQRERRDARQSFPFDSHCVGVEEGFLISVCIIGPWQASRKGKKVEKNES